MKIRIKNGRVIDPASQFDGRQDVYISNGKIIAIGEQLDGFEADKTIDATGLIVSPGLIDLSVRLREPGQEHTATILTETKAAAAGGITTVCVPPDTAPVIDNPTVVELIEDRAKKSGRSMVLTMGAMTQNLNSELLAEMARLKAAGCVGISNGLSPIKNSVILQRAMAYAATLDMTVFITPADPWLQSQGCVHEGAVSSRLGLGGIAESAETIAVSRDLILIEQTGVRAHFHNLSTAKAVKLIRDAQNRGLPVTADVSAHHLHLSEHDLGNYDALSHVLPPFRSIRDREQLQQGVRDGVISAISSHHQPLDKDDKLGPFAETKPGISGLETLLPLTMKLVEDDEVNLHTALAALTCNPADILGIDSGQLKVGATADICLIDPDSEYECQPLNFVSAGKNSPFEGWLFNHQVSHTLFHGRLVHERD
ncbi:dihydroorotase and related cyclic amidohydrolase [Methylophaga aminisulfidivorans MP]|uniref:Dihydroorotase and related cyclic amidohydrolase n=1 Tax=Methylophaga aminisulfidivorans MP TaxID=1026882 RepID=F5SYZ2_9GAMM|nr:dihydroorotase [Methylophaga aminisulfidivorans]EGL54316.1 dihydroorotase and related cyclic amidohydrolase [Methylophaga aminisulfidivorans MP]